MSTSTTRRTRFTCAEPTPGGNVHYDVAGTGVLTVGYDPGARPGKDAEHLRLAFGRWDGEASLVSHHGPLPEAPVLFGVEILGSALVDVDDVVEYLASPVDRRSSWWLRVQRRLGDDVREVPDGTRTRMAEIIAAVAEDYLDRPDSEELLTAHRRHHAPRRAQERQAMLERMDREAALWEQIRGHQVALLDYERAWAEGQEPTVPPTPRLDARYRPLTAEGAYALRQVALDPSW